MEPYTFQKDPIIVAAYDVDFEFAKTVIEELEKEEIKKKTCPCCSEENNPEEGGLYSCKFCGARYV